LIALVLDGSAVSGMIATYRPAGGLATTGFGRCHADSRK
jgi:hypothetical protein